MDKASRHPPRSDILRRRAPRLSELVYFVTSRCTSRCRGCFYGRSIERLPELGLEELSLIVGKLGRLSRLLLSGGEPFLREDLPDVLRLFVKGARVRTVVLPTNGLPPAAPRLLERIVRSLPRTDIVLSVSVDGLPDTHRFLRGTPLEPTLNFLDRALEIRTRHPSLQVHVQTVVNRLNLPEMPDLGRFLAGRFPLDGQGFDCIRGEVEDSSLLFSAAELPLALIRMSALNEPKWTTRTQRAFHRLHLQACLEAAAGKSWGFPCRAGDTVAVLEPDGSVRGCELKPVLGHVRDFDQDLRRLLRSPAARAFRLEAGKCGCTHPCFLTPSLFYSAKMNLRLLAGLFRRPPHPS